MHRSPSPLRPGRFLQGLFQGALIGLGAVLPGISGGVLCVIFGIYKPIMELLANPFRNFRTHVPRLLPVILGIGVGFLGIANLLSFFLEKYPDPSVCLFIGLIAGMLPSLFREAGEQGRTRGSYIAMGVAFASILALLLGLNALSIVLWLVSFLWLLPGAKRHCSGHELLHAADAAGAVYPLRGWAGAPEHGRAHPRRAGRNRHRHLPG